MENRRASERGPDVITDQIERSQPLSCSDLQTREDGGLDRGVLEAGEVKGVPLHSGGS